MNMHDLAHLEEHRLAAVLGFYPLRVWWIDTFTVHAHYYRFHITGRNDMRGGEPMFWRVPRLAGRPYAFALREVR